MPSRLHRYSIGRLAAILFLALLAASSASRRSVPIALVPQRDPEFSGALLRLSAGSYSSPERKHGGIRFCIFCMAWEGTSGKWPYPANGLCCRICAGIHKAGDFLVVAPDGWDTFYINSRDGKTLYGNFFLREFMPFIERAYRVRAERAARGITGFSMGGYGALRIGFAHPELFGSVSAHSAALMRDPPQGVNAGASAGNLAARILTNVFGNPIDQKFWDLNSPFLLAKKNSAMLAKTKIYFDCGTEDSYGFQPRRKRNGPGAQFPENPARIPSSTRAAQRFLSPRPPGASYEFTGACLDSAHNLRLST